MKRLRLPLQILAKVNLTPAEQRLAACLNRLEHKPVIIVLLSIFLALFNLILYAL
jgi:hypothetical protein